MNDENGVADVAPRSINLGGQGYKGQLYAIWGTLLFPVHGCIITMDDTEGKLNFSFHADQAKTIAIGIMQNENVTKLVAGQKEGENMTRSCLFALRDLIMQAMLDSEALFMDLDMALNGMARKAELEEQEKENANG